MSILIKGMEMPTSCYDCPLAMQDYTTLYGKNFNRTRNNYACVLTHKAITSTKRNRFCPLVPVPKHGDLIDYDFCMKNYELLYDDNGNPAYAVRMRDINNAPSIIPAEEGE